MHILIANQQSELAIDADRMRTVARQILEDAHFSSAALSIAIVDDATIRQLNRRYLQHDWPTDVLSFPLDERADYLEGEVVVSAEVAAKAAAEVPWPGTEELLLYVIHGTLHLVGYRDKQPEEIAEMRAAEKTYLQRVGVVVVAGDDRWQVVRAEANVFGRIADIVTTAALFWLYLCVLIATAVSSLGFRALSDFSHHDLEDVCRKQKNDSRYGEILRQHEQVALGVEIVVMFCSALQVVSGLLWAQNRWSYSAQSSWLFLLGSTSWLVSTIAGKRCLDSLGVCASCRGSISLSYLALVEIDCPGHVSFRLVCPGD